MSGQVQPVYIFLFNDLVRELNALVNEDLDEFSRAKRLHELEAQAFLIGDNHRGLGLSALGSVAAARGDEKKMRRFHEESLQFDDSVLLKRNYAVSLFVLGRVEEAFVVAMQAFEADRSDIATLDQLVLLAMNLGDEEKYLHFARLYESLAGRPHYSWREYLDEVQEAGRLSALCMGLTAQSLDALRE